MSDAKLNDNNVLVDKNGKTINDSDIKNSIGNGKYTNESFYKKLSELYGDALSSRGQNVDDPIKAKMFYYDKYQLFGNVDPATTFKSYIFFTRPDLNFSAENILNSPIMEYYYNTEIGKMIMSMLTGPDNSIGVFAANHYDYSVMNKANEQLDMAVKQLRFTEDLLEMKLNNLQNKKLTEAGVNLDITQNEDYKTALDNMQKVMDGESVTTVSVQSGEGEEATSEEQPGGIEADLKKIEEDIAKASEDLISSAWNSGGVISTYDYYVGMENVTDKDFDEYLESTGANSLSDNLKLDDREINKSYYNDDPIKNITDSKNRIQYLKDYIDRVRNIKLEGNKFQLDPTCFRAGEIHLAKDYFTVYDTYKKKNVRANFTSPFIPLLSNCCVSMDGFKDWNIETFSYDSDYFGGSMTVATGQDDVYGPGEASVEFEDIYGGPISILFMIWVDYIVRVSRGTVNPTRQNIINHVLDYTSSIYVFNCDRDGSTIRYFAKLTGCFPISCPLGSFIKFTREPNLENVKNISISFKYNRYEPMAPDVISDFNFLSMQEFAKKPANDYESYFGKHEGFETSSRLYNIHNDYKNKSGISGTSNNMGYMEWEDIDIDQCGLSGRVPFPAIPGSKISKDMYFTEKSNNYWGGYPYIRDGNKLIWVSPATNNDDVKYRYLRPYTYEI